MNPIECSLIFVFFFVFGDFLYFSSFFNCLCKLGNLGVIVKFLTFGFISCTIDKSSAIGYDSLKRNEFFY